MFNPRSVKFAKLLVVISVIAVSGYFLFAPSLNAAPLGKTPKGGTTALKTPVFAFACLPKDFDTKSLRSVTILGGVSGEEWKYWKERDVVPAFIVGGAYVTGDPEAWAKEKAEQDYGGNPVPTILYDELGFDFGGEVDGNSGRALLALKERRPEMSILIWQTPRPVKGLLPRAYKRCADLIFLEAYAHSPKGYLVFETEVENMRRLGLLEKSVLALGIGPSYAATNEEILQQVRYIRWIAPECAGIGTFAPAATPELLTYLDELCLQWDKIPTDGRDLPKEVRAIHESYIHPKEGPVLMVSGEWSFQVQGDKWLIGIRNIGNRDAYNVHFRLRNHEPRPGGEVQAEGFFRRIPAGEMVVKRRPAVKDVSWKGWPPVIEVEAQGATVLNFSLYD